MFGMIALPCVLHCHNQFMQNNSSLVKILKGKGEIKQTLTRLLAGVRNLWYIILHKDGEELNELIFSKKKNLIKIKKKRIIVQ
ncbi:hypothetical protein B6U98_03420 [Thermoplasmatales archaeon ex4572_165]|nr:MAG: hypothetical protein B6U98_03420 [Thermoplasmatales archaeon ex4572_165]